MRWHQRLWTSAASTFGNTVFSHSLGISSETFDSILPKSESFAGSLPACRQLQSWGAKVWKLPWRPGSLSSWRRHRLCWKPFSFSGIQSADRFGSSALCCWRTSGNSFLGAHTFTSKLQEFGGFSIETACIGLCHGSESYRFDFETPGRPEFGPLRFLCRFVSEFRPSFYQMRSSHGLSWSACLPLYQMLPLWNSAFKGTPMQLTWLAFSRQYFCADYMILLTSTSNHQVVQSSCVHRGCSP